MSESISPEPRRDAQVPRRFVPPAQIEADWGKRVASASGAIVTREECLHFWRRKSLEGLRSATATILDRYRARLVGQLDSVSASVDRWQSAQFRTALARAGIDLRTKAEARAEQAAAFNGAKTDAAPRPTTKAVPGWGAARETLVVPVTTAPPRLRVTMPDVQDTLRTWREHGAQEVTNLGREALARIEDRLQEAWEKGWTETRVADEIETTIGATRNRSEVYARNQIGRLYGELVAERQRKIGVRAYTWHTQRDNRVRATHRALEGKRVMWTDPPAIGHPGSEFGCRCIAEPDFEEMRERQLRQNAQRRRARR